jgi:hypothetical protein
MANLPHQCQRVGLDFLTTAALNIVTVAECNASPDVVFACLESAAPWSIWFNEIESVTYTSPQPYGVGTTRLVVMKDVTLSESFLAWEKNRRYCFRFDAQNRKIFDAGVEDIQLDELPGNRTKITYRAALQPMFILRACDCLIGFEANMRRMFDKALKSFVNYVENSYSAPSPLVGPA